MFLGRAGAVLADSAACGFKIEGMGIFWLNRRQAEEFYEIYKRIFVEAEFMVIANIKRKHNSHHR
jgi:nucleoside diphosphate kinase